MHRSAILLHDLCDFPLYLVQFKVAHERFTSRPQCIWLDFLLLSSCGLRRLGRIGDSLQVASSDTTPPNSLVKEGLPLHLHLMELHLVQVCHRVDPFTSIHVVNRVYVVEFAARAFERPFRSCVFLVVVPS